MITSSRAAACFAAVSACAAFSGCGGASSSSSAPHNESGASSSKAGEASTPSASPFAPNVGATALKLGQTRRGRDIDTTLSAFTAAAATKPPSYLAGQPDADGALIHVKECVHEDSKAQQVGRYDFTLEDAGGGSYETSSSTWNDWPPLPQMPAERVVQPGRCASGWVLMTAPAGVKIVRVVLGDDQSTAAEWNLPS